MDWVVAVGTAGGLALGAAVGVLSVRYGAGPSAARSRAPDRTETGGPAINTAQHGPRKGIGRKSLDSLRVGVVVLDSDDEPVLINPSARAMGLLRAGPGPGTIAAHPIIRTLAGQVRRTGIRREIELDLPRGAEGGAQDPLGVHLRAVGLGGGYVAVEAADVTETHRLARVRRDFVANVSHELKTPIGALQLLAEALLDATDPVTAVPVTVGQQPDGGHNGGIPGPGTGSGVADGAGPAGGVAVAQGTPATVGAGPAAPSGPAPGDVAAARRFAERIHIESTRLGRLVNELLELSRLQGAEPLPELVPVSVDWVVAEVLDRTRTAAAAKRIDVRVGGDRGATVYGSDTQCATAVANLLENAIAYSPGDTTVDVDVRVGEAYVAISVADQGIGIASADLDRIFERFYRADQARSRSTGGTGLGLAIVKHIATNHGGRVDVSSTLGEGSTFTLRLPVRPSDAVLPLPNSVEIGSGPAGPGSISPDNVSSEATPDTPGAQKTFR